MDASVREWEKPSDDNINFAIRFLIRRKNNLRGFFSRFILQWFPKTDRPIYCLGKHVLIMQWMFGTALFGEVCDDFWLPCFV